MTHHGSTRKRSFLLLFGALVASGLPMRTATAQTLSTTTQANAQSPVFQPSQLEITPYVWGLQINSDDQIGNQSLNAELSLGHILHNLTGLAELEVVPRYKHLFFVGDGIYASLDPTPKPSVEGIDHVNLQAGLATLAAGYSFGPVRLNHNPLRPVYGSLQPFVGAQYTDIAATARSATPSTVARLAEQWWTPTVGGRIDLQTGRYLARLEGDYASFQSNRNAEQVLGAVGHQTSKQKLFLPSINIGYRYLYEKNRVAPQAILRAKLQGPIFFVTFHL